MAEQSQTTPPKRRCSERTKAGKKCKAWALHGSDVCLAHADAKARESVGFIARNGKQGRPRNPRAVDVLRERIEGDIDKWLRPLEDGLTADHGVVVGDGPTAHVEFFEDHRTRIRAHKEGFDRAFGKPTQPTREERTGDALDREIERLLGDVERLTEELAKERLSKGRRGSRTAAAA